MDSADSAAKPAASNASGPPATTETGKMATTGASTTHNWNHAGDDDDEEEEGMLKVDEEGQIEDDGADQQVSPPSYCGDGGRPVSLADRLASLPDPSAPKAGVSGPSNTNGSGYVSPRNLNLDRERDRDRERYLETSPGPSSGFVASRSRYGYPPDAGSAYGAPAPYSYPSGHRDPHRPDSFSSAARTGFSVGAARAENRRGWYPPATPTRGPDTYRPGAARERDRDREWESFRDDPREREWSAMERERERDAYAVDKRRDWPARERGAAPFGYDMPDSNAPYPASTGSKYKFDAREMPARRPASPPPLSSRERELEGDRSRDRDRERPSERDPRIRASSSGWGNGMRQWGKPSDAGWDNRSARAPTSEDARSDASYRPSAPRSNNTPPPATSSEAAARPSGSDNASVKSETRSREMSPTSQSASHGNRARSVAADAPSRVEERADERARELSDAAPRTKDASPTMKPDAAEQGLPTSGKASTEAVAEPTPKAPDDARPVEPAPAPAGHAPVSELSPNTSSADKAALPAEKPAIQPPKRAEETTDAVPAVPKAEATAPSELIEAQSAPASAPVQTTATDAAVVTATVDEANPVKSEMPSPEEGEADVSEPVADAEATLAASEVPEAAESANDAQTADVRVVDGAESVSKDGKPVGSAAKDETATAAPTAPATSEAPLGTQSQQPDAAASDVAPGPECAGALSKDEAAPPSSGQAAAPGSAAREGIAQQPAETQAPVVMEATVETPIQPPSDAKTPDMADVDMSDAHAEPVIAPADAHKQQEASPAQPAVHDQAETTKSDAVEKLTEEETQPASDPPAEKAQSSSAAEESLPATSEPDRRHESEAAPVEAQAPTSEEQMEIEQAASAAPTADADVLPTNLDDGVEIVASGASAPTPPSQPAEQADIKVEESVAQDTQDVEMGEATAADEPAPSTQLKAPKISPPNASLDEAAAASISTAPAFDTAAQQPEAVSSVGSAQTQVSGPHVTATVDHENHTREITLPQVNYGDDKEAQALVQQENARIEEVEMPTESQKLPPLRIAEVDDESAEVEAPPMTPTTQEQVERAVKSAVRRHIQNIAAEQDDWKRIMRENQRVSQRTTMDVLKAKIHGIPQIVSSGKPLWLEEHDDQSDRTKAVLFDRLLDRKKRLNDKVESLKKRYRSINEDWKLHCSRLDRIAERREMARRPPVNTPAGTPGGFGSVDDPSPGGTGAGLLAASLTSGRANRRSAQAGFAGFGDAVRSEAEFLEILASLENADMQDPNMRAARTTATAPDMYINPDSDQPLKLRYDDINGSVADPLAFYLDEFDPDVWSEEEKAIFARRYALWPKQFGKIAQALPHKTPAQCVRYYYLSKKVPGNDFKALAAARNRERKRKARVKPKKAKGSALMADLKSAKGEEVDDVEDSSGVRSPMDATDLSALAPETPAGGNARRGGRSRLGPAPADTGSAAMTEDAAAGRKRTADQIEAGNSPVEVKASDKRRSGAKSKRPKSDSASGADKSRKSKSGSKKEAAALEEGKGSATVPTPAALPAVPKTEPTEARAAAETAQPVAQAAGAPVKESMEDSDLAAAEALGALAGLFGGAPSSDASAVPAAPVTGTVNPSDATVVASDADADGRKAGKKRRSKTALPGEEGAAVEGTPKGRGRQPTSSYWSVAERSEFLRALVVHGPRWDVVSSTLAQKSAAQARNYFARNESEPDFAEAAALARNHGELPVAEREAAATAFVRQRFANNAAAAAASLAPNAGAMVAGGGAGFPGDVGRTTHLPPPPGIVTSQMDAPDGKVREGSPEVPVQRRGLQINSLLNDSSDSHDKRRSSLHEWQEPREAPMHVGAGRDSSVPPTLYSRPAFELERRPVTADRAEGARPPSSDGRSVQDDAVSRPRVYEREGSVDSRSWAYEAPYDAHRRPSPSPGYSAMAPPPHPGERMTASRYAAPAGSVAGAGHLARSVPPLSTHVSEEEHDRGRSLYGTYGAGRGREYEAHSMPPSVPELRHAGSGEQVSPTGASFGAGHAYGRYAPPSVGSIYASSTAATTALSARGRSGNGPLTAPAATTAERPAYEQRWQRYSQSPGPPASSSAGAGSGGLAGVGGFSTASAYRSSASPYSSFPSQSLPRPSLPSLSAGAGKVGAPHLPSLGAAGRSLPPILGSFPAPGRGLGAAGRPQGAGEEARYWPYPQRPRGHDQQNRNPE